MQARFDLEYEKLNSAENYGRLSCPKARRLAPDTDGI